MTFRNSKFESPSVLRQAEINFEQSRRVLQPPGEKKLHRRVAQMKTDVYNQNYWIRMVQKEVEYGSCFQGLQ